VGLDRDALVDHLASYATYHRVRANIVTHALGLPMIALGGLAFLSRFGLGASGLWTPALVTAIATSLYYLSLDLGFGITLTLVSLVLVLAGRLIAALPPGAWILSCVALIGAGTLLQFLGHYFEGRRPAFIDDLRSTLIGPLFILADAAFALGLRRPLRDEIERRAGPLRARAGAA
jgi:uncharacterized membrane protein YGL010W